MVELSWRNGCETQRRATVKSVCVCVCACAGVSQRRPILSSPGAVDCWLLLHFSLPQVHTQTHKYNTSQRRTCMNKTYMISCIQYITCFYNTVQMSVHMRDKTYLYCFVLLWMSIEVLCQITISLHSVGFIHSLSNVYQRWTVQRKHYFYIPHVRLSKYKQLIMNYEAKRKYRDSHWRASHRSVMRSSGRLAAFCI